MVQELNLHSNKECDDLSMLQHLNLYCKPNSLSFQLTNRKHYTMQRFFDPGGGEVWWLAQLSRKWQPMGGAQPGYPKRVEFFSETSNFFPAPAASEDFAAALL